MQEQGGTGRTRPETSVRYRVWIDVATGKPSQAEATQHGTATGRLDAVSLCSHPGHVYVISGLGGNEASAVVETTVPDRTQRRPQEGDEVKFAGKD